MIIINNPQESKILLDHDCFDIISGISGKLKKNFDSLILSDFWPEEVSKNMIVNNDEQAILRARSIIRTFGIQYIKDNRFLDYGCGKGHCVVEASKLGFEAVGYDVEKTWEVDPEDCVLTTDKAVITAKAPYAAVSVYDVLDHIVDHEKAVEAMKFVCSVSNADTIIRVRCHPWTSRHGGHLYNSINKAFAHILLSDEEYKKHSTEPVRKIKRPLMEYSKIFEAAGLKTVQIDVTGTKLEELFTTKELQDAFEDRLQFGEGDQEKGEHKQADGEWQSHVLPMSFIDYILAVK